MSLVSSLQIKKSEIMMRKYKFKGLKKSNGEWAYGDLITPIYRKKVNDSFIRDTNGDRKMIVSGTECLFTGLVDKDDKEIYEDDILDCGVGLGIVKMSVDAAGYVLDVFGKPFDVALVNFALDDIKVVGNVFEDNAVKEQIKMNYQIANICRLKMIGNDSRSWDQLATDYGYGDTNVMINEFVKTYIPKYRHFVISHLRKTCEEFTLIHEIFRNG